MLIPRKNRKTSVFVLVAVLLTMVLAACGDNTATTAPATTAAATTAAAAATTAAAHRDDCRCGRNYCRRCYRCCRTGTAPAIYTGPKATVTYMTWENNDTNASLDAAMALFMKANPNITVTRVASPSTDYGQKINSMLQAKQLPDIIWSGNDTEQQFGSQGLLYDWTSLANSTKTASFDISKFAPGSIDNWKVGDPAVANCSACRP